MISLENYFSEKHADLITGYRTPNGKNAESCAFIALDIANLLLCKGREPSMLVVKKKAVGKKRRLYPLIFGRKISWDFHVVCECSGDIYDPILEGPVPVCDYGIIAFGEDVSILDEVPYEELVKILRKN